MIAIATRPVFPNPESSMEGAFRWPRNRLPPRIARGHSVLPTIVKSGTAGYVIRVEMPGIKPEELKVELVGRRSVCVSVSRTVPREAQPSQPTDQITDQTDGITEQAAQTQTDVASLKMDQPSLQLFKRVDVPQDADTSKMHLTYTDGLLVVEVPRKDAAAKQADAAEKQIIANELDEECAKIREEMKERAAKVLELRAEMQKESRLVLEARGKLCKARKQYASKVLNERKELFFQQETAETAAETAPGAQV